MAITIGGTGRRGCVVGAVDDQLDEYIQQANGFIVGDVFLGLRGLDQGQGQHSRGVGHQGSPQC